MATLLLPPGATIGDRLRAARCVVADLSGRELDRLAGRPENLATQIEADRADDAKVSTLRAYVAVLGLSVEWLATGGGEPPMTEGIMAAVAAARAVREVRAAS